MSNDRHTIIETERLILRSWTLGDVEAAFTVWGDPEVMRFVDDGKPFDTLDRTRRSIERGMEAQRRLGFSIWPMVEKSEAEVIGCCGFHYFGEGPALELIVHLARSRWGRGYATEAARACIEYGFIELGAERIVAAVHPKNIRSRQVIRKAGMTYVGPILLDKIEEVLYAIDAPETT